MRTGLLSSFARLGRRRQIECLALLLDQEYRPAALVVTSFGAALPCGAIKLALHSDQAGLRICAVLTIQEGIEHCLAASRRIDGKHRTATTSAAAYAARICRAIQRTLHIDHI